VRLDARLHRVVQSHICVVIPSSRECCDVGVRSGASASRDRFGITKPAEGHWSAFSRSVGELMAAWLVVSLVLLLPSSESAWQQKLLYAASVQRQRGERPVQDAREDALLEVYRYLYHRRKPPEKHISRPIPTDVALLRPRRHILHPKTMLQPIIVASSCLIVDQPSTERAGTHQRPWRDLSRTAPG